MNLLASVFSKSPGCAPYRDVVAGDGKHAPTAALLLAVICLSEESVAEVSASFTAGLVRYPGLPGDVCDALAGKGLEVAGAEESVHPGPPQEEREYIVSLETKPLVGIRYNRGFIRRFLNPSGTFTVLPKDDDPQEEPG